MSAISQDFSRWFASLIGLVHSQAVAVSDAALACLFLFFLGCLNFESIQKRLHFV